MCVCQKGRVEEKGKQQNREKNDLFKGKSIEQWEIVEVSCCNSFLTPWLSHDKDSKYFSSGSRAWWQLLIPHTSRHGGRSDSDRGSLFPQPHTNLHSPQHLLRSLCKSDDLHLNVPSGVTLLNMLLLLPTLPTFWDSWQQAKKLELEDAVAGV